MRFLIEPQVASAPCARLCPVWRRARPNNQRDECVSQVVVATGKARGPWAARILPLLGPAVPGVFMQVLGPFVMHLEVP